MTWTSSDPATATVLSKTRTSAVIKGLVPGGPVTFTVTATVGSVTKTADPLPSLTVRPAPVLAPSTTFVSEIHYDDPSTDANERIEIEGDAGSSLQGWSLVLYNGNGAVPYSTTQLSGLIPANCTNGRGVVVIAFPTDGIQNGSPDGWALVNAQNQVTEFRSYEGTMVANDGPAFGIPSTAIDVDESTAPPDTRSVQRAGNGVWFGPMSNTFGRCNAAVPPPPQKILVADGKELIAVGMQTQFFYSGVDNSGQPLTSVTWSTSDPSIITVDQKGILTAKQLGTAQLIATAPDGAFGTADVTVYLAPTATFPLRLGHNEEFGEPVDGDASNDFLIHRAQYSVSYNPSRGGANWVSWNLSASHIGNSGRCEGTCYSADTVLSKAGLPAYTTADWVSGATWDRGHMAPSADWTSSEADNNTTFFLTNFLPQAPDLNQGPWERLEAALRDSVGTGREVYIIAGGIFTNGTGLGSILNLGKIWIPDSTYKIAIITPAGTGIGSNGTLPPNTTVMAVNMPNVQGIRGVNWMNYLTTIARVEQSTGYNFLDLLSEPTECVVENRACSAAQGIADIGGSVASLGLTKGNANSLTAKIDNAAKALASGNATAAKNMIEAFINEVSAGIRSGRIARTAGDEAIALARRVLAIM
jgi:DNA/RNA endonuclease G (NUC1)